MTTTIENGAEVFGDVVLKSKFAPAERVAIDCSEETHGSMTDQAAAQETEINAIVERFTRTGTMPKSLEEIAQYGDVSRLNEDLTVLIQRKEEAEARLAQSQRRKQNDVQNQATQQTREATDSDRTGSTVQAESAPSESPASGDQT